MRWAATYPLEFSFDFFLVVLLKLDYHHCYQAYLWPSLSVLCNSVLTNLSLHGHLLRSASSTRLQQPQPYAPPLNQNHWATTKRNPSPVRRQPLTVVTIGDRDLGIAVWAKPRATMVNFSVFANHSPDVLYIFILATKTLQVTKLSSWFRPELPIVHLDPVKCSYILKSIYIPNIQSKWSKLIKIRLLNSWKS